jgi:hypothetical protein
VALDAFREELSAEGQAFESSESGSSRSSDDNLVHLAETSASESVFLALVQNLMACDCLKSACEFSIRMLKKHPHLRSHAVPQKALVQLCKWCEKDGLPFDLVKGIDAAPDAGSARRELYPSNDHEPDRFSEDALSLLNEWMREAGPKLEVKATTLPVLLSADSVYVHQPFNQSAVFVYHFHLPMLLKRH